MPTDSAENGMMPLRLVRSTLIADDIRLFEMRRLDGGELPEFTAGSHIVIRTPNGLLRKYSLCNAPTERDRYAIAVKREADGRGGSRSLVDESRVGDELLVSAPRNSFALVRSAGGYIFIAGGIGITPIMAMVRHLTASGPRNFRLFYCTRKPEATLFREQLSAPELRGRVKIHHDEGDPERMLDLWPVFEQPRGQHVYCCGPRSMMQAVRDMTGHWAASAVHFEAFTEPSRNVAEDRAFTVRLAQSGETIDVAAGVTILEALRGKGHVVPSSCESGTCGTCRTRLLGGEADHRDLVLTDDEKASNIMICVSRARSPELIIDR
ncbi:MAG: oxidoreductase [Hyphomicrobiaceae bacterium]|nr:oxidoreductase [Hyphomicrobiaceae bacterium]